MSRVLYHTIDELNQSEAAYLSGPFGLTLEQRQPRDDTDEQGLPAVYDLDFWCFSAGERKQFVLSMTAAPLPAPVAVHSWNLTDEQIDRLRGHGVLVFDRLEPRLFAELATAVAATHARPRKESHSTR